MSSDLWHVLLVEDDEDDYLLTRDILMEPRGSKIRLVWAQNSAETLAALAGQRFDVLLVDYNLGEVSGLELMKQVSRNGYRVPFILMTGHGSYELDMEAMQAGATDYIAKGEANATLLERAIRYAIERHRLMQENLQQKELLELIFETEPGALAVVAGQNPSLRFANQAYRALLSSQPSAPDDGPDAETSPLLANEKIQHSIQRVLQTGQAVDIARHELSSPDGSTRHFAIYLRGLSWQGEPAVLLVSWETTDLVKAQKQLQQAAQEANRRAAELNRVLGQLEIEHAWMEAVINSAPTGIIIVSLDQRIVLANPVAQEILERPLPLNASIADFNLAAMLGSGSASGQPDEMPLIRSLEQGETHLNVENRLSLSGGQRTILTNTAPICDPRGGIIGAVAVFIDITGHKKAEEEVRRSLAQIEVQRHLMQSRERERLHIAQDLHDGPLQGLIAMSFGLKMMIQETSDGTLTAGLKQLSRSLKQSIDEIRSFAGQLRPPALAPFGLEKAIHAHVDRFRADHPGIKVHINLDHDGNRLPEETRLALYRIYQELLNNVLRHTQATEVWVQFTLNETHVALSVTDNGCGFEVPSNWINMARAGHLGLVGVQERAAAVNGQVEITSQPGSGTSVRITAPIDAG